MSWAALMFAVVMLAPGQEMTTDRPQCCGSDNRVIVVSADEKVAVALGRGLTLDDGSIRFFTYTVFRRGVAASNWTTPAYIEGSIDVRCEERTARVGFSRLYRGNGDPIVSGPTGNEHPFTPISEPTIQRPFDVACGDDPRVSYEQPFVFMEAYGLNDGRHPRVGAGPMVR